MSIDRKFRRIHEDLDAAINCHPRSKLEQGVDIVVDWYQGKPSDLMNPEAANVAIPILRTWHRYFLEDRNEGLGSSYERILLNRKLQGLIQRYQIRSALEVPIFGFTGLSGINSMWLAKNGIELHLVDNNQERIALIRKVWDEIDLPVSMLYQTTFETLPFASKSVDFSWNYSALWFVGNLQEFAQELTRSW